MVPQRQRPVEALAVVLVVVLLILNLLQIPPIQIKAFFPKYFQGKLSNIGLYLWISYLSLTILFIYSIRMQ